MNWCDPSNESRPIISPAAQIEGFLGKRRDISGLGVHECFLMLQSGHGLATLQEHMQVREEPFPLPAFLGKRPLYVVEGSPPISLVEKAFGAPVAADVLEVAIAMGARNLYFFGLCGAVGENVNVGDLVVPAEIRREEGTSYHYLPTAEPVAPCSQLRRNLVHFLGQQNDLRVHAGATVSTDAVYRQTLKKERRWREQGILGVDMEMSALLAVAKFHDLPAVCLFVVSDKHVLEEESKWQWGGQELTDARARAVRLFVEFIREMQSA